MTEREIIAALGALAQETRLRTFRLLVQAGETGLPAGEIARHLNVSAATLSFHLSHLSQAGLLTSRRAGRSIIYAAHFTTMEALLAFLREDCCAGRLAEPEPETEPGTESLTESDQAAG